ncbi:hypothetical protein SAMN04487949_0981 [Halogranum gelatinilyticum]|uniref:Uncharacterized protein n=1 Tax=Halogranum gelatinilyticum TaxID=660521 RepID=A0A1G9QQK2_9EURY|nr:HTH domain-containing protein [Halogranum gelatinilyticum]SDM13308.1 hypothetical protein SAMN04487949_0981 [Halogranum gelatinilyticum]
MTQTPEGETRVELWVNAPDDAEYEPLVAHLERLEAAGEVDAYVVYHWGHELDVSSDRLQCVEDQLARERVAAFKQWATENGCTVLGLGERATVGVGRMGPEVTVEQLPPVLLAEYVDDDLRRVTPCSAGDEHVSERLATLDSTELPVDGRETKTRAEVVESAEPATAEAEAGPQPSRRRLTRWRR